MVRTRQQAGFDAWLAGVKSCSIQALEAFAVGLERDADAVRAALSLGWSNRPTEGVVNRIKLVKRMMYGRASVPLLRKMVVLYG